ncbi:hypothetical protein LCGC14_1521750 [marine sediment metagenome]|uniref:Uncharacterized protein n=1 Tax=marine sediment metagenome TaxID=412755 RepID=A0A0F9IYN2_9ZZZZ
MTDSPVKPIGLVDKSVVSKAIEVSKQRLPHKSFANDQRPKLYNRNLFLVIVSFLREIVSLDRIRDVDGLPMLNGQLIKTVLRCIFFENHILVPNPSAISRRIKVINRASALVTLILQKTGVILPNTPISSAEWIKSFSLAGQVIDMPKEQLQTAIDQLDVVNNIVKTRCSRSSSRKLSPQEVQNLMKLLEGFNEQLKLARSS